MSTRSKPFKRLGKNAHGRCQRQQKTLADALKTHSQSRKSGSSCITAKLSGCLTAISIDCSARQPVVPLASSPSSARWMRRSGCLLTAMSAASGGAHSDLGTSIAPRQVGLIGRICAFLTKRRCPLLVSGRGFFSLYRQEPSPDSEWHTGIEAFLFVKTSPHGARCISSHPNHWTGLHEARSPTSRSAP